MTLTAGPAASIGPLVTVDVDLDGDLDVVAVIQDPDTVLAVEDEGRVVWVENLDGAGAFGAARNVMVGVDKIYDLESADLDGDLDPDILITVPQTNEVLWSENVDGKGRFGPPQLITGVGFNPTDVEAADLDGDGDLDVAAVYGADAGAIWLRNRDGAGTFGPERPINQALDLLAGVATGDLDGDGDADLCVSSILGAFEWYENDGLGAFRAPNIIVPQGGVQVPSTADLDGDGALDVLYAGPALSQRLSWHRNEDGAGSFGSAIDISTTFQSPDAVVAEDLDLDGDLDIVASGTLLTWYRNQGAGWFESAEVIDSMGDNHLGVGDLSGDGKPDVALSRLSGFEWYSNGL